MDEYIRRLREIAIGVRLYGAPEPGLLASRIEALCVAMQGAPSESQADRTAASQFLSDVVTAAGLLSHGKTDKALAGRIGAGAIELRKTLLGPNRG